MKNFEYIDNYLNVQNKKVNKAVSTQRLDAFPIDYYSVFENLSSLSSYSKDSAAAYEGQIVAVKQDGKQVVYVLDTADDVSATGLRRVGVLSASELCGLNGKLALSSLSDISTYFGKAWIKNPDSSELSVETLTNLSVVKIPIDEFGISVVEETLSDNVLYIVSADYIECYGQQICNVVMNDLEDEVSSFLGIAATDKYVEKKIEELSISEYSKKDHTHKLSDITDLSDLSNTYATICSVTDISNDLHDEILNKSNIYLSSIDQSLELSGSKLDKLNIVKFNAISTFNLCSDVVGLSDLVLIESNYLDAQDERIRNVKKPEISSDAATKQYVDEISSQVGDSIANDVTISAFMNTINLIDGVDKVELESAISALYRVIKILTNNKL